MPDRITLDDAAAQLGRTRRTVERYIASGQLPAYDVAPPGARRRSVRVDAEDVERLRLGQPLTTST